MAATSTSRATWRSRSPLSSEADEEQQPEADVLLPQPAGLGVDIVDVERMGRVLSRTPRFAMRVFTDRERAYCEGRGRPEMHYAARFAAKEAVAKALGSGFSGFGPADVEVVSDEETGRPLVRLHGGAAQVAERQGVVAVHVSLSHTPKLAVANAVAVTSGSLPRREERDDPKQRLERAFKEARSLLDEMDALQHGADLGQGEGGVGQGADDLASARR